MAGNETHFVESSDSGIRKLVANAVPESTEKSRKCLHVVQLLRFSAQYSFFGHYPHPRTLSADIAAARMGLFTK